MRTLAEKQNKPQARTSSLSARHHVEERSDGPVQTAAPPIVNEVLASNAPDDSYEQEADRLSERVLRVAEPKLRRASACACGGGCPACQTKQPGHANERLPTGPVGSSDFGRDAAPPIVYEVIRSPGQPLDPPERSWADARFAFDFSNVRIHADSRAADSACHGLGAVAFTVGRHVVFGRGQYSPGTHLGRSLLAHELAHVVQQGAANVPNRPLPLTSADDATEQEASALASAALAGEPLQHPNRIAPTISREVGRCKRQPPRRILVCCEDEDMMNQRTIPNLLVAEEIRRRYHPSAVREYAIPHAGERDRIGYADLVLFRGSTATVFEIKSAGEAGRGAAQVASYTEKGQLWCTRNVTWVGASSQDFPHRRDNPLRIGAVTSIPVEAWWHGEGVIAYETGTQENSDDCDETTSRLRDRALPHFLIEDYIVQQYSYLGDWKREFRIPIRPHATFPDLVLFPSGQNRGEIYEIKQGLHSAGATRGGELSPIPAYDTDANAVCTNVPGRRGTHTYQMGTRGFRGNLPWPPDQNKILDFHTPGTVPGLILYHINDVDNRRRQPDPESGSPQSRELSRYYGTAAQPAPAQPATTGASTGASATAQAAVPAYVLVPYGRNARADAADMSGVPVLLLFVAGIGGVARAGVAAGEAVAAEATAATGLRAAASTAVRVAGAEAEGTGAAAGAAATTGEAGTATATAAQPAARLRVATEIIEAAAEAGPELVETARRGATGSALSTGIPVAVAGGTIVLLPGPAHATRLPNGMTGETRQIRAVRNATTIPQSFITTGRPVVGSGVFVRGSLMRIVLAGPVQGPLSSVRQDQIEYNPDLVQTLNAFSGMEGL